MKVQALIDALTALVRSDEFTADAEVTYGADMVPVEGGIIAKNKATNLVVLNLAPISLDQRGGF